MRTAGYLFNRSFVSLGPYLLPLSLELVETAHSQYIFFKCARRLRPETLPSTVENHLAIAICWSCC